MQHERNARKCLGYFGAAPGLDLGLGLVEAVNRAYRDGERVDAGCLVESNGILDGGDGVFVAHRHVPDLALAARAEGVRIVGGVLCELRVLFKR